MPWVRVSDDFMDHDRFEDLSLDAIGLWLTGLAWSNRNLKDGRITRSKVHTLHADVSYADGRATSTRGGGILSDDSPRRRAT